MSGELTENTIANRKVQQGDGCLVVTLPADPARELGITAGDRLLFTGQEGDSRLAVQPTSQFRPHQD